MSQPSIDCLVQRKRLIYMARLAYVQPKALWAILQASPRKQQMPWTCQACKDIKCLYSSVAAVREALPDPVANPNAWFQFMSNQREKWHRLVDNLFYSHSCLDQRASEHEGSNPLTFKCEVCCEPRPAFATAKALAQHQRIKHKTRNVLRLYVDGSGVCPCCKNVYHTRYRVLCHLQNPAKPACKEHILNSGRVRALKLEDVRKLDEMDKIAIGEARKQGRTHPKVTKPAMRADGACIGCVRT